MKLLWHVFVGIVLINLLAAAGFVGWMYLDGRIDKDRIDRVVDMFSLTIDQEEAQNAEALALEEQNQQMLEQRARLEQTANGPETLRDRLDREKQIDETVMSKLRFFNDQNRALREEMARFQEDYNRRVAELEKEKADFEQWVQDQADKTEDANFQQVVALYQTQPAKQTKQAFQSLMQQGQTDQVVEYLAAMSSRKAGQVLSQFKTPAEIAQATYLLEQLRQRGEYTLEDQPATSGDQS